MLVPVGLAGDHIHGINMLYESPSGNRVDGLPPASIKWPVFGKFLENTPGQPSIGTFAGNSRPFWTQPCIRDLWENYPERER